MIFLCKYLSSFLSIYLSIDVPTLYLTYFVCLHLPCENFSLCALILYGSSLFPRFSIPLNSAFCWRITVHTPRNTWWKSDNGTARRISAISYWTIALHGRGNDSKLMRGAHLWIKAVSGIWPYIEWVGGVNPIPFCSTDYFQYWNTERLSRELGWSCPISLRMDFYDKVKWCHFMDWEQLSCTSYHQSTLALHSGPGDIV